MKFKSSIQAHKYKTPWGIIMTGTFDETIDAVVEIIVKHFKCGIYKDRIREIYKRTSEVCIETSKCVVRDLKDMGELENYKEILVIDPKLHDAIPNLDEEKAIELFETVDLNRLKLRFDADDWLFVDPFEAAPFYTIDEQVDVIKEFKVFYEFNHDPLIKFGFPKSPFYLSPWLDNLLGRIYFTKLPIHIVRNSEGYPPVEDIKDLPSGIDLTYSINYDIYAYLWSREDASHGKVWWFDDKPFCIYPAEKPTARIPVELCNYEDAEGISDLSQAQKLFLENNRQSYYDMVIEILDTIHNCLQSPGKSINIWKECLEVLKHSLTKEETRFYFAIDEIYDILEINKYLHDVYDRDNQAEKWVGITNLISFIGHCEKEIKIGTYDKTKAKFIKLPEFWPDLIFRQKMSYYSYPDEVVDSVLDTFLTLNEQELKFWEDFEKRVNIDFKSELEEPEDFNVKRNFVAKKIREKVIGRPIPQINYEQYDYLCEDRLHIPGIFRGEKDLIEINKNEISLTPQSFKLLLRFVVELKKKKGGWISADTLDTEDMIDSSSKHNYYYNLRKALENHLYNKKPLEFIQKSAKGYRISTLPDFVSYNKENLQDHPIPSARDLANELPDEQ